jgi:predicted TIM-barrel fold metal-dependent hydrolase
VIVDSHCHAWRRWPYQPPVPDPESRARVEQLLWEMDRHGVDRAAVVCARIEDNPDNNDYVADCVRRYPDRLYQLADVDCQWMPEYHSTGAAARLAEAVERYRLSGFTHYVKADDDGSWFLSEEGLAFLEAAASLRQVASFAIPARLQPVLREIAKRFPSIPFLCHHMAGARVGRPELIAEVLASAAVPNIHVKLSGWHYVSPTAWSFPYVDVEPIVRALYEAYGSERLHWGSDYPVCQLRAMTYQQSLEAFSSHTPFIPESEKARILGDSLAELLTAAV